MAEPTTLTTERMRLRPYAFDDLEAMLEYAMDPQWARFLIGVPQPYTRAHGEQWIARCMLTDWNIEPQWAIENEGRCSGGISIRPGTDAVADFGFSIAPRLWGQGLVVEAATAVFDWAFAEFDLAKVCATADAENRQSWRVMEKLGMQREGYFRQHRVHHGERRDVVFYAIMREEWKAKRE